MPLHRSNDGFETNETTETGTWKPGTVDRAKEEARVAEPLSTQISPDVARRLRATAAVRDVPIWQLVDRALDGALPRLPELLLVEPEASPVTPAVAGKGA